jgi:hypothetical protein
MTLSDLGLLGQQRLGLSRSEVRTSDYRPSPLGPARPGWVPATLFDVGYGNGGELAKVDIEHRLIYPDQIAFSLCFGVSNEI